MNCLKPVRITKNLSGSEFPNGLLVPCGKCYHCKKQKAREWSVRMLHELENHKYSNFITLTYDDDHIPPYNSLIKNDLQKFFKRLRQKLEAYNVILDEEKKIKYFACGEYGNPPKFIGKQQVTQGYRPHYHAIIFGLGLANFDKMLIEQSWSKFDKVNNTYEPFGMVHFGLAEPLSIKYVTQYINKKFNGELEHEIYNQTNRENQFKICSNGIGYSYCDKYSQRLSKNMFLTVNGNKTSIPRYYLKKLDIDKTKMKEFAEEQEAKLNMKLAKVKGTYPDYVSEDYSPKNVSQLLNENEKRRKQVDKNIKAKISLSKGKL